VMANRLETGIVQYNRQWLSQIPLGGLTASGGLIH